MRLSKKGIFNIRRGLRRSWQVGGSHDLRFRHKEVDADTLRQRALNDRRGTIYAEIKMAGENFVLLWSVNGRTDQIDIFNAGKLVITCRPSLALARVTELVR